MKAKNQDVLSLIKSMTLFHSPMIKVVFGHRECVNEIIDIILGRHIHIDEHHVEYYMSNIKGREAQFDIYAKSEKMRINVEIQRKEKGANPKRGRLNLSLIDTQEIKKSSEYEEVPESYIVFMCEGDYFKKGLPIYHLKLTNKETKEEVDIGQEMIYVNGDYQDEETVLGRLIHDFHCIDPNEMYSEVFKRWMKYYKEERKGVTEMCEICEQLKEMGRIEGLEEGELIGIRIVKDNDDIMMITDTGTVIRLNVKEISVLGRPTQGVTLMRTNEGKVVSIEVINEESKDMMDE